PDWEFDGDGYRVRIEGRWLPVPAQAMVRQQNKMGHAMVWLWQEDGQWRIGWFMPGARTGPSGASPACSALAETTRRRPRTSRGWKSARTRSGERERTPRSRTARGPAVLILRKLIIEMPISSFALPC